MAVRNGWWEGKCRLETWLWWEGFGAGCAGIEVGGAASPQKPSFLLRGECTRCSSAPPVVCDFCREEFLCI